jgi:hypothetical protein
VKILSVSANARRRTFEVKVQGKIYTFPYAKCEPRPSGSDPVVAARVDPELAREAFTYRLKTGQEGSVHVDQVLEYNKDPSYLRNLMLYQLTLAAQGRLAQTPLSKREIIRRLATSPAQLYRLLDQTNYAKSVDQMLRLLSVLECDVKLVVRAKSA